MDEHFERLCRIYPDSKFALIPKYVSEVLNKNVVTYNWEI